MFYLMAYRNSSLILSITAFYDRIPIILSPRFHPFLTSVTPKRVWVIYFPARAQSSTISQSLNRQRKGSTRSISRVHSFCCSPVISRPAFKSLFYCTLHWQRQPCLSFPWCALYSCIAFVCIDTNITINHHPGARNNRLTLTKSNTL